MTVGWCKGFKLIFSWESWTNFNWKTGGRDLKILNLIIAYRNLYNKGELFETSFRYEWSISTEHN